MRMMAGITKATQLGSRIQFLFDGYVPNKQADNSTITTWASGRRPP
jgi:hypothetical protein